MDAPTASVIHGRSALLQQLYSAPGDLASSEYVEDATELVMALTCLTLATVPDDRERIALRAVTLKVEEMAILGDPAKVRSLISRTTGGLKSISAGSWSESYLDPGAAQKARMLSANPQLHEALWALMDEDCRQAFLDTLDGDHAPYSEMTAIDWGHRQDRPPPAY